MSVNNFIPEIWSQSLLISLKEAHVAANLVNRNYEGEISNQGDTVRITTPLGITVDDYDGSDFEFDDITSSQQTLVINQAKKFNFQVKDIDQVQSNVALRQPFTQEAGYSLARAADLHFFSGYDDADAANVIEDADFTASTAFEILTEAGARLSEANVPEMGRWVAVSPREIKALSNDPAFQRASDLGDQTSRFGFQGMAAGFNVWMTNNLAEDSDTRYAMFGHNIAVTWADQLIQIDAGKREANFADFVKGLHVYGKKTVRPTALGVFEIPLGSGS